ncbi:helix-turn-helix domain-containing protein [Clostridium botulinum]|uniref:helix-turn-helix domain-containing protein n=1 Tax=Clostridium botulinum TaxID=1491 RepID=UPI001FA94095|nr:helix-turn-helix transcriptional regulator [Clostridium botulinum]
MVYLIGLEYVLSLYNLTQQELAEELGIKKQNISQWFKGSRKIPKKYLSYLNEKFKIPIDYFNMEIKKSDELKIKIIKLKNENPPKKVTRVFDTAEEGKLEIEEEVYEESIEKEIILLNIEIKRQELLEIIYKIINFNYNNEIDDIKEYVDKNRKVIGVFDYITAILESKKVESDFLLEILNAVVLSFEIEEGFDMRPFVRHLEMIFQYYEFDEKLGYCIEKHNE